MTIEDIVFWEINEAFSGQVLACLAAWEDKNFCKTELGLSNALGKLDQNRLDINGGAIAIGHSIGASGARIAFAEYFKKSKRQMRDCNALYWGRSGRGYVIRNDLIYFNYGNRKIKLPAFTEIN